MTSNSIRGAFDKISERYFSLKVNQRLYVNAAVILITLLISMLFPALQLTKGALFFFLLYWISAVAYDLVTLYKKLYESVLGKAFLIILFSLCTNLALALSSQVVNIISGVDPAKFPHTVALLSILNIPIFIAAGFFILYGCLIIGAPFLFMFHTLPNERTKEAIIPGYCTSQGIPYQNTTRLIQFISLVICGGFIFNFSQMASQKYDTFLHGAARYFMFQMEMYSNGPCAIEPGQRVAFFEEGKILVGEKTSAGLTFKVHECKALP